MDTEEYRTKLALFRYGVIAPLVCRKGNEERMRELREQVLSMQFEHPDGGRRQIPERTVRHRLSRYRKQGFEGLFDDRRSDRGASRVIPPAVLARVEALLEVLKQIGPALGCPRVDTLKDSKSPGSARRTSITACQANPRARGNLSVSQLLRAPLPAVPLARYILPKIVIFGIFLQNKKSTACTQPERDEPTLRLVSSPRLNKAQRSSTLFRCAISVART
jgi:hypothetical protein